MCLTSACVAPKRCITPQHKILQVVAFALPRPTTQWNGMIMVRAGAAPLDAATGFALIHSQAEADDFGPTQSGTCQNISEEARKAYVARVLSLVDATTLALLKILVNAGNGAAGPMFDAIATELAARGAAFSFVRMHRTPHGSFPNGIANHLPGAEYELLALAIADGDGLGFDLGSWRSNLRSSNNEPVVRLNVET